MKGYVADFREFLRKAFIRNFVMGIEIVGDEAVLA
jgi:hypothetical protein